ncbi:hypothetical protein [Cohnella hongkongensis]|uniref:Uncharacterized protein n=1 Tax=Cohnella hongkongensis TaxID=178337 RepID=A0ABV9FBD3_9BACL
MDRDEAEELLARKLSEEPAEADEEDAGARAARRLHPKWEIRIQASVDPIVEETKAYRAIAREVDDRYDDVGTDARKRSRKDEGGSAGHDVARKDQI